MSGLRRSSRKVPNRRSTFELLKDLNGDLDDGPPQPSRKGKENNRKQNQRKQKKKQTAKGKYDNFAILNFPVHLFTDTKRIVMLQPVF